MKSDQPPSKSTYRVEREFGVLVGFVLILLGSWWLYRGYWELVAKCFLGCGSLLVILGLLLPKTLVYPNRAWMGLARILSFVVTPIILALIFFLVVMPIGVIKRLFGWDPLRRRTPSMVSYWHPYNPRQRDPRHFEKMY